MHISESNLLQKPVKEQSKQEARRFFSVCHDFSRFPVLFKSFGVQPIDTIFISQGTVEKEEEGATESSDEEDAKLQKRLEKTRHRAAAAVRAGGKSRNSRNASKDKGGRRSRHVSSSSGYEV